MTAPIPPGKRKKSAEEEEDELMREAYGNSGAALRKTLATPHKDYGKPEVNKPDSTFSEKVKARVRRITGG